METEKIVYERPEADFKQMTLFSFICASNEDPIIVDD